MSEPPACPSCQSEFAYPNGHLFACPDCGHEWAPGSDAEQGEDSDTVTDAHGHPLQTGDTVKLIKDLKVKGTSTTLKIGTKVKNIRIIDGAHDGHDIDCKVDGIGAMRLKSEFVKKA